MKRRRPGSSQRRGQAPSLRAHPASGAASRPAFYSRDMPLLIEARELFQQGRHDEALTLFDQAVGREPANVQAIVDAIRAHGRRYRIAQAEQFVERLVALDPRRADLLQLAGESYLCLQRPQRAAECFERACRTTGRVLESQAHLAALYERTGRLEQAHELVNRALRTAPDFDRARLILARIQRNLGQLDDAEATLRPLAGRPGPQQAEAWGQLGELLDQRGDYDGAFAAVLQCKQLLLPGSAKERQAADFVQARFAALIRQITPDHLHRWRATPLEAEPSRVAMLTGFPRSGTTLLEQALESHPGLVSSEEQDVISRELFPSLGRGVPLDRPIVDLLDALSADQLVQHRKLYRRYMESLLGESIGARVHLDKNPAMNPMLPVVRRLFPEMKLLVALRDPRDVIVSCFLRHLPLNPVSVCFLSLERAAQRYALDMQAWLTLREMLEGDWIEVRYERLVADLPGEVKRSLDLVGLPWDDRVLDYRQHSLTRQVRSPSYADVARPVYSSAIGRWRNYVRHLAPVLPALDRFVRAFGYEL